MLKIFTNLSKQRQTIWGISRTGNRAIAGWIYDSTPSHKLLLNDQLYDEEPTSSSADQSLLREFRVTHQQGQKVKATLGWPAWSKGDHNLLIILYENHDLRCFEGDHRLSTTVLGGSDRYGHILVLRDIFNHYASFTKMNSAFRIKHPQGEFKTLSGGYSIDLWKHYAREFIGLTKHLPANTVKVNFNRWVAERDYRKQLAAQVGIPSDGRSYQSVPSYGGGSSFDGLGYDGKASEMKVLERWTTLSDAERHNLLETLGLDSEAVELIQAIYPDYLKFL